MSTLLVSKWSLKFNLGGLNLFFAFSVSNGYDSNHYKYHYQEASELNCKFKGAVDAKELYRFGSEKYRVHLPLKNESLMKSGASCKNDRSPVSWVNAHTICLISLRLYSEGLRRLFINLLINFNF